MSAGAFDAMLAAHNQAALEALSSKGLARRAARDLGKGKAEIRERSAASAEIIADGQTVTIDAKGPSAAACTCSAAGICRHILLATLALRAQDPQGSLQQSKRAQPAVPALEKSSKPAPTPTPKAVRAKPKTKKATALISASDSLLALSEQNLIKFAGADWPAAVQLAASQMVMSDDNDTDAVITKAGLNTKVEILGASVMFIAGQGLKGAAYKGPVSKARMLTAACAILVRGQAGMSIKQDVPALAKTAAVTSAYLQALLTALERSLRTVLTGAPEIAADILFDYAISARAAAAPRLTAQLRGLASAALLAARRHVDFSPASYMQDSAKTYALVRALLKTPTDAALTGSLSRDYKLVDSFELIMLGADSWQTASGARGLTSYGFAPHTKTWHSTVIARGAGMDPSFSARKAYYSSLWQAGSHDKVMGKRLTIPAPRISKDGQIAQTLTEPAKRSPDDISLMSLANMGVFVRDWDVLSGLVEIGMGSGLRRNASPQVFMVFASKVLDISYDDMAQTYYWGLLDEQNRSLYLQIPASRKEEAVKLQAMKKRIQAVLVTAQFRKGALVYAPVSILTQNKGMINITNIRLDDFQFSKLFGKKRFTFSMFRSPKTAAPSAIPALMETVLEACAQLVSMNSAPLQPLAEKCEQAGLLSLSGALNDLTGGHDMAAVYRAAYLASEIKSGALMQGAANQNGTV